MAPTEPVAELILDRAFIRASVLRAARLLAEAVMIPSLLLYAGMATVGKMWGLAAVLVWCAAVIAFRWKQGQTVPRTLLMAIGMVVGRTSLALALSSVYVYVLQPIAGSVFMAVVFLGSAAIGRPITQHLAHDFLTLPKFFRRDKRAHRMFTQVCVLWGISRLIDAGMTWGFLQRSTSEAVLSRGFLSSALTVVSVLVCTAWGWSRIRRMDGFRIATG